MPRKTPKNRKPASRQKRALAADSIPRIDLGRALQRRINQFGLSRDQAAHLVGDAASQMSRLMTGHFHEFSADRLVKMLLRLGVDVEVVLRVPPALRKRDRARVASVRIRR